MTDVVLLAMPFFGLIFLGFAVGKLVTIPDDGMVGLNFFILYLALPALFFQLISQTPIEELGNWRFVLATTLTSLAGFTLAFTSGFLLNRGSVAEATIQGLAASYGNIGYMAPGLTLAAFGAAATVPTALVFCFDNTLFFTLAPLLMALAGGQAGGPAKLALAIGRRVLFHPFIIATIAGVVAAAIRFVPPGPIDQMLTLLRGAAAPCALFAMGVTIAKRPVKRIPVELPIIVAIKLIVQPIIAYLLLGWFGDFNEVWVYSAVLMASLPTATNVFVLAQQYQTWVQRASATVLITTVASVATVTALLYLISAGILPPDPFP
jgi:predicted permease